ncbi:MAG: pilus assembly protein, partial [Actinobacteria bacterium]|nr:pilus assembly protein [Actinomycetota bacterium]
MRRLRGETGMATVELAAALPALVLVIALGIAALTAVVDEQRVQDAAAEAARAAARGDDPAARRLADRLAPGSRLTLRRTDGMVTADVA